MHAQLAQRWHHTGRASRVAQVMAIMVIVMALTACGGGGDPTGTAVPQASPTVIPTAVPSITIGDVVWTGSVLDSGAPGEAVSAFPRDTRVIHAVVQVKHVPAGSAFSAVWSLDGSELLKLNQTVTVDSASDEGWVAFTLTWGDSVRWPAGTLEVTITGPNGVSTTGSINLTS